MGKWKDELDRYDWMNSQKNIQYIVGSQNQPYDQGKNGI